MNRKILIPAVLILAILLYSGWRWYQAARPVDHIVLSGFVEGTEVIVRSQAAGNVIEIGLREGDRVKNGDRIASIDPEKQNLLLASSRADLSAVEIDLSRADEELSIFEAQVERNIQKGKAGLDIAEQQLLDMENGYPAEDVESAKQAMELAGENRKFAEDDYERYKKLFSEGVVSEKELEKVEQVYNAAEREYKIRKEAYDKLKRGFDVEKVVQARKNVDIARITLNDALAGKKQVDAKRTEIEAMRKKADAAREKISLLESSLRDFTIESPVDGIVSEKNIEIGELASPGTPIVTIVRPDEKWMRVYVPATRLGSVKLGDILEINLDAFEERVFKGKVSYISEEAEFTPKNVQIKEERVKQVYELRIDIIENPELVKTGMEGDAILKLTGNN